LPDLIFLRRFVQWIGAAPDGLVLTCGAL
jgi:hypothetical protein